jgi:AcrR family transcriptional regulator
MTPATDRRIRRTRTLLHQALIELILEKGYGRITVQDILDRADIGRSTFYSHYRDKDALLLDGGLDHLKAMIADAAAGDPDAAGAQTPLLHPALVIFRLADGNRRLYRALIGGRGSELAARTARTMLSAVFAEHLRTRLPARDGPQLDITVAFLVNGLMGLLTWWLDNQAPLSAEQMHDRFEQLATHGIQPPSP